MISPETVRSIEAYFQRVVGRAGIPGAALTVIQGGEAVVSVVHGVSNLATGAPVTADTVYAIGSLQKSMTALAILQLRDRGILHLDDPVQRYLPWFRVADEKASQEITLRQLLTHASGIPGNAHGVVWQDPAVIRNSVEAGVRALRSVRLHDQRFDYCNMGYNTLGLVVAAVSGQSYEAYLNEHLLASLGMTHSTCDVSVAAALGLAQGYTYRFGRLHPVVPQSFGKYMGPSGGGMMTSLGDLGRYAAAHLGYGNVVAADSLHEAHKGLVPADEGDGAYAMGWWRKEIAGTDLVYASGGTEGSSTEICLLPGLDVAVVLIFGVPGMLVQELAFDLCSLLVGAEVRNLGADPFQASSKGMLYATVLGAVLLPWAGFIALAGFGRYWMAVVAAVLSLPLAGALWYSILKVFPEKAKIPTPLGVRGWPVDFAWGVGMLTTATTVWSIVSIVGLLG